jgi:hypothetical protein
MGTFNEFTHIIKDYFDEQDTRISLLQSQIKGLQEERKLLKKKFLEGDYKTLKNYYSVEK